MNELLFESIKMSLKEDLMIVYDYYNEEYVARGVGILLNKNEGFGNYIYTNTDKLIELIEYLNGYIHFPYKFTFRDKGEEEFYPLVD